MYVYMYVYMYVPVHVCSFKSSHFRPGPNSIALLTGKQIFVLTVADKKLLKHKRISQVSKEIQSGACAFTVDLCCCVTHLLAITAGKLACLSLCLVVSSAMKWRKKKRTVSIKLAAKRLCEIRPCITCESFVTIQCKVLTFFKKKMATNCTFFSSLYVLQEFVGRQICVHVNEMKALFRQDSFSG